jgi:tetratricopeptide (TPR) repeat protein
MKFLLVDTVAVTIKAAGSQKIEAVFTILIADILDQLKRPFAEAADIVIAMTVFPTEEWVPALLLEKAVVTTIHAGTEPFAKLAKRCVRFGLLEHNACKNEYLMPRIIKAVLIRDDANTQRMNEARERLADYLLVFLKSNVCRLDIEEAYWNSLVCDEMANIDPYWPIIDVVMYWPGGNKRALEFALLMVHYMDSRFLNNQRLKFIGLALEAPNQLDIRTRALLYIDGYGWTYMEEGANELARDAIASGLALLPDTKITIEDEWDDLRALAYAWRARIDASEDKKVQASKHIDAAITYARRVPDKPWILLRVEMMAGDVEFMDGDSGEAVAHYMRAAECAELHGGEGDGYQTNPRIGLALLEVYDKQAKPEKPDKHDKHDKHARDDKQTGDDKPARDDKRDERDRHYNAALETARRRFSKLVDNSHVPTGRLYGQYGMALIAARENLTGEARRQLQQIQKEIRHRGRGNVLLKLAEKSYEKILSTGKTLFD